MKNDLPIYNENRKRIIALHHLSFVATKIFFFVSRSKVSLTKDWLPRPDTHYVVAANHVYWSDPFVVTTALGWRRLRPLLPCRFIAAPKFLSKSWLRTPMRMLGAYPSHPFLDWPYGIDASIHLLAHDSTIVIFPQGKITRDRTLPAKRGVKLLAEYTNTAIIPVFMKREGKIIPKYTITVGKPQNMSRLSPDQIMQKIFELDTKGDIL